MTRNSDPSRCPGRMPVTINRRELLRASANGFGMLAFSALFSQRMCAAADSTLRPHFAPKAKNVIFCFMDGGVSHVDSFDPKPKLAELDDKPVGKVDNPTANTNRKWLKTPWKFRQHGQSGRLRRA